MGILLLLSWKLYRAGVLVRILRVHHRCLDSAEVNFQEKFHEGLAVCSIATFGMVLSEQNLPLTSVSPFHL